MSTPAMRSAVTGAAMTLLTVLGCADRSRRPGAAAGPEAPVAVAEAPQGPVIVRVEGRGHPPITVTSGPDGPRYSAHAGDGRMIVSNVTLDELWADHPDIARFVEPALVLDARGDAPARPDGPARSFSRPSGGFSRDSHGTIDARR